MKMIKEMWHGLVESFIKLITSNTTSAYFDKGFGFTCGSLVAIVAWIGCMCIISEILSIITFPFKAIRKLLKK